MMKRTIFLVVSVLLLMGCKKNNPAENTATLTVYSYNSMSWIKDTIKADFESLYNCTLTIDTQFTDTGDMLSKVVLEKQDPKADIILGITPALLIKAKQHDILSQYKSPNLKNIKNQKLLFDSNHYTTPYDYGSLAIIYNPEKIGDLKSFSDLWKMDKQLVIQDPRTSSTGLDFLMWTIALYGDNWKNEWKSLHKGILATTSGWSESFAKFESGEASMMVSYATDLAYSYHYYKTVKNKIFIPEEGGYIQIEGASIIKGAKNKKLAEKFIDYVLTKNFQEKIPLNQWMFPVIDVEMPEAFNYAVEPQKTVSISNEIINSIDSILEQWESINY